MTQMSQLMQGLQQQEGFNKLNPQQQQQLALQVLLKQQQQLLQAQAMAAPPASTGQPLPQPQNLSPRYVPQLTCMTREKNCC